MDINQCTFTGRLGQDSTQFKGGIKFNIAVSKNYKDKNDEWQSKTLWLNVTYWKKDLLLAKGEKVFVAGELEANTFEGKTYFSLNARVIEKILGRKPTDEVSGYEEPPKDTANKFAEDVPF